MFENMDAVRVEKARLKLLVEQHSVRLEQRAMALKDPELRSMLLGNTLRNSVSRWGPGKFMVNALGTDRSGIGGFLSGVLTTRAHGFKGKVIALVVGALAPAILERLIQPEKLAQFIHYLEAMKERITELLGSKEAK